MDIDAALNRAYRRPAGFARVVIGLFLLVDLAFKSLIIQELVAALFLDGISTAREVTEMSGRGLGMGALQSAVQALGGDLEIDSEPGRGTCVRLRFPEASVRPGWQRN